VSEGGVEAVGVEHGLGPGFQLLLGGVIQTLRSPVRQ
jgi:hypothetical protein